MTGGVNPIPRHTESIGGNADAVWRDTSAAVGLERRAFGKIGGMGTANEPTSTGALGITATGPIVATGAVRNR